MSFIVNYRSLTKQNNLRKAEFLREEAENVGREGHQTVPDIWTLEGAREHPPDSTNRRRQEVLPALPINSHQHHLLVSGCQLFT